MFDDNGVFIPITEWKCFKEVASVLGEAHAHAELYKVFSYILSGYITNSGVSGQPLNLRWDHLIDAFTWFNTPQGDSFWRDIHKLSRAKLRID